jgi:hypothetical protein
MTQSTKRPIKGVPKTNKRLGYEGVGTTDIFYKLSARGLIEYRVATIEARTFQLRPDFELTLEHGDDAGTKYQTQDYQALVNIVRLAYDK